MLIGFTGTQSGMTKWQKEQLRTILELKNCSEFMHGDCIGADDEANFIAYSAGVKIYTIFPPEDMRKRAWCFDSEHRTRYNRIITPYMNAENYELDLKVRWMPIAPYLERNKRIVDTVTLMIAAPKEHRHTVRSGTWSTIRYAWKTKKDIIIIPPIERPEETEKTIEGIESQ